MEAWVRLSVLQAPTPPSSPVSAGSSGSYAPAQRAPPTHEKAEEAAVTHSARLEAQRARVRAIFDRGELIPRKMLFLFAFSVLCQLIVVLVIPRLRADTFGGNFLVFAAGLFGGATSLFLGGGLIPVVVWAFRRFARKAANGVMTWWTILIALFAGLQYYGRVDPTTTWSVYTAQGCGYSVSFPSAPTLSIQRFPIGGKSFNYDRAQLIAGKEWLRAECIPHNIAGNNAVRAMKEYAAGEGVLKAYAAGEGLQRPLITQIQPNVSEVRGYKAIGSEKIVIVLRIYHRSTSVLLLTVGSRESDYPTRNSGRSSRA